jgi:hypothetical protein
LTNEAIAMRDSLRDPTVCSAVLVGLPEPWPLTELGELSTALRREIGMGAGTLVVNKLWPLLPPLASVDDREVARMLETVDAIGKRGREQREVVAAWLDARGDARQDEALVTVPWWPWGVEGPEQLRALLSTIEANGDAADAQLDQSAHS